MFTEVSVGLGVIVAARAGVGESVRDGEGVAVHSAPAVAQQFIEVAYNARLVDLENARTVRVAYSIVANAVWVSSCTAHVAASAVAVALL